MDVQWSCIFLNASFLLSIPRLLFGIVRFISLFHCLVPAPAMIRDAAWPSPEFLLFAITWFAHEQSINNSTIDQSMALKQLGASPISLLFEINSCWEESKLHGLHAGSSYTNSLYRFWIVRLLMKSKQHRDMIAQYTGPQSTGQETTWSNVVKLDGQRISKRQTMAASWCLVAFLQSTGIPASILYCSAMIDRWRDTGVTIQFRQQLIS